MQIENVDEMVAVVAAHPDYQVLRRLQPKRVFSDADGTGASFGLILDTETTGLDTRSDKMIELALLEFDFDPETGRIFSVTQAYSGFEDPEMPIPAAATAVNHITDEMVAGHRFDDDKVAELAARASIVIAHNAKFDRPITEARFPAFASCAWACSCNEIDWKSAGFSSASLEFIAYKCGFFHDKHRAEVDCRTLIEVLHREGPAGEIFLRSLLVRSSKTEFVLWAANSRFDCKDELKERGYRWDGDAKSWYLKFTDGPVGRTECEWLWENRRIFERPNDVRVKLDTLGATERFTDRTTSTKELVLPLKKPNKP